MDMRAARANASRQSLAKLYAPWEFFELQACPERRIGRFFGR
jgi:hypothetical protein